MRNVIRQYYKLLGFVFSIFQSAGFKTLMLNSLTNVQQLFK